MNNRNQLINMYIDIGLHEYYKLEKGKTYAFRVIIMNKNLQWSNWSDELVFVAE